MPSYSITNDPTQKSSTILDALCLTSLVASRGEGRKLIAGGGLYLNDVRVTDPTRELSTNDLLHGRYIALRKGKRTYEMLSFNPP